MILDNEVVSIHAPRVGGDKNRSATSSSAIGFNPRPPRGGRPTSPGSGSGRLRFQSTPPRGGRQLRRLIVGFEFRGFQSTPPRGGRPAGRLGTTWGGGFNPRPRVGGDASSRTVIAGARSVSIHAPAWGATTGPSCQASAPPGFNPRPRVGGDASREPSRDPASMFQSTPPRGGRRSGRSTLLHELVSFQSTPPRGGRPMSAVESWPAATMVSIHAPAWGATGDSRASAWTRSGFNPRPRVGGDLRMPVDYDRLDWFQSTPPRGGRRECLRRSSTHSRVSIHAPAWGATARWCRDGSTCCRFQSTPPRGGRLGAAAIMAVVA